jgi:S-(hydroxymethyl)glutathione dehydrogenase/alcohol dehydrogenase
VKIKAAVLREINKGYSIEELELDPPREGEVLVKYAYAGYCHSDLSNSKGFTNMQLPMVAGHEAAGVVQEVGPGVTRVQPGDHVASTWMCPCGDCPECREGLGNICSGTFYQFVSGTMLDGTSRIRDHKGNSILHGNFVSGFSDYTVVPEGAVIPLRKDLPLQWGALMSCCIPTGWGTATKLANVQPGDAVAVWGLGGVGQNALRAAKMRQANPLVAVDIEEARREKAMKLGATHFVNASKQDPVPFLQELTGGGMNIIFECSGDPGATIQAFWALRPSGKLMQVGIQGEHERAELPLTFLVFGQKSIIGGLYGSISTKDDIPKYVEMAMSGDMMLDTIIEGYFPLEEINDIREKMERRELNGRWVCKFD